MSKEHDKSRTVLGDRGVRLVAAELTRRGYNPTIMPNHNVGFDIRATRSGATPPRRPSTYGSSANFEVEVKCSTSAGTQVPMQIRTHLECSLQHRYYVIVKDHEFTEPGFFIMSHEEIQKAWDSMPRIKPNGDPYVIRSAGYIDWKHIEPHENRWDKLPA